MTGEPILVVEDHPANLRLAEIMLITEGYEVRVAADATQALAVLKDFRPRLILLDLRLPGMDGFTLARLLKDDPATRDILILALTAYATNGDEERALAAGCDGYVAKPIDIRKLVEKISGFLAGKGG